MLLDSSKIKIKRQDKSVREAPEIKDPSITKVGNKWMIYASVGDSITQTWRVGRFEAASITDTWTELGYAQIIGLSGPQMCAPAVQHRDKENDWIMYIQTACFEENGVICSATSKDGKVFTGVSSSLLKSEMVQNPSHKIVGLYDVGISEVDWEGKKTSLMVFSGYRSVGNGDLYMVHKGSEESDANWSIPQLILSQEQVPFHNKPGSTDYEWGLEGAKIVQLAEDHYLLIGVCFASLPLTYVGHRQRIFFASSKTPFGPFTPVGVPFLPMSMENRSGEQGHPDIVIDRDVLWIIYQERASNTGPWYLCYAKINIHSFSTKIVESLQGSTSYLEGKRDLHSYYFHLPRAL